MKIFSVGVNEIHDSEFNVNRTNKYKTYLLLLLKTPALFDFGDDWVEIPEATAVLYAPKSVQVYKALGNSYIDDWMHIEAEDREIERFGIELNKALSIKDVERTYTIFRLMKEEYVTHGCMNTDVVENLLSALLYKLAESKRYKNDTILSLEKIRNEVRKFPMKEWLLADVARKASLSVSRFEALYTKEYEISFTADVIKSRVEYAKDLLETSSLSIKQISEKCGYSGESYFSRQFKNETGHTPSEWRKK